MRCMPTTSRPSVAEATRAALAAKNREIARVAFYDFVAVVEKLPAAKTRPYRRVMSGTVADVVGGATVLTPAVAEQAGSLVLAAATAGVVFAAARSKARSRTRCCRGCATRPGDAEAAAIWPRRRPPRATGTRGVAAARPPEAAARVAAEAARDQARAEAAATRARIAALEASTSWRVTAPASLATLMQGRDGT